MPFLGYVIFGALIGATVRLLVAKRAGRLGVSTLGGALGALFGGLLGRGGEIHGDLGSAGFATALLAAFAVVGAYHLVVSAAMRVRGVS